jgi:hypothetical protein
MVPNKSQTIIVFVSIDHNNDTIYMYINTAMHTPP